MGKRGGSFLWGIEKKNKNSGTDYQKQNIDQEQVGLFLRLHRHDEQGCEVINSVGHFHCTKAYEVFP